MAENGSEQALLLHGNATTPHAPPQKKLSEGARRFRRSRTAPSSDPGQEPHPGAATCRAPFVPPKKIFATVRPSVRLVGFLLLAYLLIGATAFYLVMDHISGKRTNRFLDAVYFCIVTMTTVGYGDLVPSSNASKLLACAFVFTGMAVVATFLSKSADYLVEKQEVLFFRALHMKTKGGEAQMLRGIESNKIKYKFYTTAVLLAVVVAAGTAFLWKVEGMGLVDAFYCVCATITTLGYGDKSFSSESGRVFAVFWIITSTVIMAQFFLYLAELYTESRQRMLARWVLTRRMTNTDLEAADLDGDHRVGAADFVLYKLKELGKISQEEISSLLEEFDKLDVDHSGTLSPSDLALAQPNMFIAHTTYIFLMLFFCA